MMGASPDGLRLAWAKSYPFGHPKASYLFSKGTETQWTPCPEDVAGLIPVIASGSNAAPDQLARKYTNHPDTVIPVTRADVHDFDSVYNAHVTAYGSIPATLFPSPGTRLSTFITWLDKDCLQIMHKTEQPGINYHYAKLSGIQMDVDGIGQLDVAFAYISVVGCLLHDGGPISLAEVPASGRVFSARTQEEMHGLVRDVLAPKEMLDPFIMASIEDAALGRARSDALAQGARRFEHSGMEIIEST